MHMGLTFKVSSSQPATSGSRTLLSFSDISYLGAFQMPSSVSGLSGDIIASQGLAGRYVGGQLRFFYLAGLNVGGQTIEVTPPAQGTWTSDPGSGPRATLVRYWGETVGAWPANGISDIYWDAGTSKLFFLGGDRYDTGGTDTLCPIGYCTLNEGAGTFTVDKTVFLTGRSRKMANIGMTAIPSWFTAAYLPAGYTVACGFGAYQSAKLTGPASMGTAVTAISPSAIVAASDLAGVGNVPLVGYPASAAGPGPTTGRQRRTNTSFTNEFDASWDPSNTGGVGYWSDTDAGDQKGIWIDTGTKHGFLTFPVITTGRTWYENSDLHCEGAIHSEALFDPADFAAVVNSTKQQYEVQPYAERTMTYTGAASPIAGFDGSGGVSRVRGAWFDATTNRYYLSFQRAAVQPGSFGELCVYAFQVN